MNLLNERTRGAIYILFAIFASSVMCAPALATKQLASSASHVTDRVIIKLRAADADDTQSNATRFKVATAGMQMKLLRMMSDTQGIFALENARHITEVEQYASAIAAQQHVEFAEPDYFVYPAAVDTPNDPYFYRQWSLSEPSVGMNVTQAWELTTGVESVVVAVIDSGITHHEEFDGRLIDGFDFITADSVGGTTQYLTANDGDGRDADPSDSGDWVSSTENNGADADGFFRGCGRSNSSWHGTHVAGIVGANPNNNVGITGINWESKIMPLRVLGKCGGYVSDIADAIRYAAGQDQSDTPTPEITVDIINLSLSRPGRCSRTEQSAIDVARDAGVTVITAAGNNNGDADAYAPGNCNNVINIGASGKHGGIATYSNTGNTVDVSAPGGDFSGIISTLNSGNEEPSSASYSSYVGTSMAAAQVSGVVSLMLSVNPELTPDNIEQILITTAQPFLTGGCGYDDGAGSGIIDAYAAVTAAQNGSIPRALVCDSAVSVDGDTSNDFGSIPISSGDAENESGEAAQESTDSGGSTSPLILLLIAFAYWMARRPALVAIKARRLPPQSRHTGER